MLVNNRLAAELALAHGASACTDISGFGLLGHLLEMLGVNGAARLELAQLPLHPGAVEQIQAGILSTMHAANVRSAGQFLEAGPAVDEARKQMLFDPQTSGGLLIAVPTGRAQAFCDALHQAGYAAARIIGNVVALTPGTPFPVQLH